MDPFEFEEANKFICVWPGDEPITPMYGGQPITVPARHEVADKEVKGSPYRYGAAVDVTGKKLPGTVEIEDAIMTDVSSGQIVRLFDAQDWVRGLKANNKHLFDRGFTVVKAASQVAQAMEEGLPKWQKAKVADWKGILSQEYAARMKAQTEGRPEPPLTPERAEQLERAIMGIKEFESKTQKRVATDTLADALGITPRYSAPPPDPVKAIVEAATAPKEKEPEDDLGSVAEELVRIAREKNIHVKNEHLKGLVLRDPAAIAAVEAQLEAAGALNEATG